MARLVLSFLTFCALLCGAQAQLRVELKISRRLFMSYEPIVATVSITNMAGRDLMLADTERQQWFLFQIRTADDRPVGARNPDYEVPPLLLPAGETLKRTVNLTALYPIDEFGMYRVRASIYVPDLDRYFTSAPTNIEISEGRATWEQTVGVADANGNNGGTRVITLLQFRQPRDNMLYVRITSPEEGKVLCTYPLGRLIVGNEPSIEIDRENQLHVLQVVAPKSYVYSRVGPNGEWLGQKSFTETKTRPQLARLQTGVVEIKGGQEQVDTPPDAPPVTKLSDRPAGMPKK